MQRSSFRCINACHALTSRNILCAADYYNARGRLLDNSSQLSVAFFPGNPGSIVSDGAGGILVGDAGVRVRRVKRNAAGNYVVSTLAGNGTAAFSGDGGTLCLSVHVAH